MVALPKCSYIFKALILTLITTPLKNKLCVCCFKWVQIDVNSVSKNRT